ncbi:MAG: transcriptional regulator, partial [Anaerolineae bacterium]|nr:transcriptional regulator [Anaerolineae bacterium]
KRMSVAELDPVIHQPTRLRIMAALVSLNEGDKADFIFLRDLLGLTDGNLSVHLQRLEEAGYVRIEKTFVGRRPKTWVWATAEEHRPSPPMWTRWKRSSAESSEESPGENFLLTQFRRR